MRYLQESLCSPESIIFEVGGGSETWHLGKFCADVSGKAGLVEPLWLLISMILVSRGSVTGKRRRGKKGPLPRAWEGNNPMENASQLSLPTPDSFTMDSVPRLGPTLFYLVSFLLCHHFLSYLLFASLSQTSLFSMFLFLTPLPTFLMTRKIFVSCG